MKRIVTVLLASFAVFALPLAAQNATEFPAQNATEFPAQSATEFPAQSATEFPALSKAPAFRAGLFGSGEAALGDYASYIGARAGGGLSAEFALPLLDGMFGAAAEVQGDRLFASSDKVAGGWSCAALAGVWYYLPLGKSAFVFQPEVCAGVVVHGVQTKDEIQDMPNSAYVDFAVQLAPSFRFAPANLKGFEFELSPVYTFIPVQKNVEQFLGARIGVRYLIQGKSEKVKGKTEENGQVQSERAD